MMRRTEFPPGWDEERVEAVLAHYNEQSDAEAVAEDEAPFSEGATTVVAVPFELLPAIRELLAQHAAKTGTPVPTR